MAKQNDAGTNSSSKGGGSREPKPGALSIPKYEAPPPPPPKK